MSFEPTTGEGRAGLSALLADPAHALVGFDYDGTLAPIVTDPTQAVPHPDVVGGLSQLAAYVGQLAIVTGRAAQVAVRLAALDKVAGLEELVVLGHYGLERWDAATGELHTTNPPPGLAAARAELPAVLESLGLRDAAIEDKGLSIAVHVRALADSGRALDRLKRPLQELAARYGLVAEPGKKVIELRPRGMDKGRALRELVEAAPASAVAFIGDDLGDLAAFDEVDRLRATGLPGLLVCSASTEESALAARADLVVDGPAGVAGFIAALLQSLRDAQSRALR